MKHDAAIREGSQTFSSTPIGFYMQVPFDRRHTMLFFGPLLALEAGLIERLWAMPDCLGWLF